MRINGTISDLFFNSEESQVIRFVDSKGDRLEDNLIKERVEQEAKEWLSKYPDIKLIEDVTAEELAEDWLNRV